ncbi:MAG TPA: TldD/PmbA family protein [Polyangiales bacterium]|nr:TldD/PmbA family protein [Polyangiales bacterium]
MALPAAEARRQLERMLAIAKQVAKGADVELELEHEASGHTRFACNEISTAGEVERMSLSLRLSFGQRSAAVRFTQLDPDSLRAAAVRCSAMARVAPEQPERMPLLGPQRYPQLAAVDPQLRAASASLRAQAAADAIRRAEAAGQVIAGFLEHGHQSLSIANSAGLWGHQERTRGSFDCTARTPDGTGSGWAGGQSNRWADFDVAGLTAIAIDKAARARSPKRLPPGRYSVVLEPAAAGELLSVLVSALDERSADEGRSFFSKSGGGTRVGERLWPESIELDADPSDPALCRRPWSRELLPLTAARWIEAGKLSRLPRSRYWAAHKQQQPLAEPAGLRFRGGDSSLAQLVGGVQRGVLITRFWYLNFLDPNTLLCTGLTRDGTFLIERGEIVGPVNNFRWNESPHTLLKNCDGLSASVIAPGFELRVPAIRSHEFNLASVSEAI